MAQPSLSTDSVRAFLDNDDNPDIRNPIHSTQVARNHGFSGPLVGGVTVWSWSVPTVLDALGEAWLDHGWAGFRFRRPVYPGDAMAIRVGPDSDNEDGLSLRMTNQDGVDCVVGRVGLGDAPWLHELSRPATPLVPADPSRPPLTLAVAPVDRDWVPLAERVTAADALAYLDESHAHRPHDPRFRRDPPRLHPGWIAGRCEALMRHNHDIPMSMHIESRAQFLAPAHAGGAIITGARVVDAFERKGHHAVVFDALIAAQEGPDLARIRHTTIFKIARPRPTE